ncbi:MAG: DUF1588 domain-containing protein [Deltaproteobacteria bacterium]|nr:DUF1588 domain-containing protein [Deltaproteobacteria bacterium]
MWSSLGRKAKRFFNLTLLLACAACTGQVDGQTATPGASGGAGSGGAGGVPQGGRGGGGGSGGVVAACGQDVGPSPWRRLSRDQYANTVRDLVPGANVNIDRLSLDERMGPFKTNLVGNATDITLSQYMESAEQVAATAVSKADTIVACDRKTKGDEVCAFEFITKFGRRAYRRPLTMEEQARYQALYKAAGAFAEGVGAVVATMLESPHFLYLIEIGETDPRRPGVVRLTPFELASRLSYFLWSSGPDAELLDAAQSGQLGTPAGVQQQITRLLASDKARTTISSFHLQWLDIETAGSLWREFPGFDKVSGSIKNETQDFVNYVLSKGDGRLETLLTAPFTIAPDALVSFYGATRPAGADVKAPVMLDPKQRAGVLTQASFLAVHAAVNQTSPVSRGVAIRRNLLCQDLPDPPPNVNAIAPEPKAGATTRERFAAHSTGETCKGCHQLIDGVGLGFEHYDGVGAWRDTEEGKAIDATGMVVEAGDLNGAFNGGVELAKKMSRSSVVRECVARQWFRYSLGRNESEADECLLQRAIEAFKADDYNIRTLITAIATGDAFSLRHPGAVGGTP